MPLPKTLADTSAMRIRNDNNSAAAQKQEVVMFLLSCVYE